MTAPAGTLLLFIIKPYSVMHYSFVMPGRFVQVMKQLLSVTVILSTVAPSFALTKTWTGLGADGLWATAANWNNNSLPAATDDVLLDNTGIAADYTVTLPNTAVHVKTISLSPGATRIIRLLLPATNTVAPALTVSGPGYGILINSGGVFRNESGLSTGASLSITDSIRINNGGRYIHSTRSPSASSIVQFLSKAPGTERGIFEYDVPGTANYDVSVTKRVYGTLVLSAAAAGGNRVYSGGGANQLTVNGNLEINPNVTFRLDMTGVGGNVSISGDYIQTGGVFNIAYGANTTVVKIAGQLLQSAPGIITETDAGLPVIELNGSSPQNVSLQGGIANSVAFRINNPAGAVLQSPLSLPYKLELVKGVLSSYPGRLLTLAPGCSITADSSSPASYIAGPLRKEGLSNTPYFLFPVGNAGSMQWAELKQATGNFTITWIKADPHTLSNISDSSIAAISASGYWTIEPDALPAASAYGCFAYTGPNNAGITDMTVLRAAQLSAGKWTSRGNTGFTGSAGGVGSVTSEWIPLFTAPVGYYTLAAAAPTATLGILTPGGNSRPAGNNGLPGVDVQVVSVDCHAGWRIKTGRSARLTITLFTIAGQQLKTTRLKLAAGNSYSGDGMAALPAGLYVLRVCDEKGASIVRLLSNP